MQEKDDLLSRFVKMSKQGDSRFGDRALRDIMINYILAGKDSTSAAICWTIYLLVLHPEVAVKVREELADLQKRNNFPGMFRSNRIFKLGSSHIKDLQKHLKPPLNLMFAKISLLH